MFSVIAEVVLTVLGIGVVLGVAIAMHIFYTPRR